MAANRDEDRAASIAYLADHPRGHEGKPTIAQRLHDEYNANYVTVIDERDNRWVRPRQGAGIVEPLSARGRWAARFVSDWNQREQSKIDDSRMRALVLWVDGDALNSNNPPVPVGLRTVAHDDLEHGRTITVDLGDAPPTTVVVTSSGWRHCDDSPALFRRSVGMGQIPVPVPAGDALEAATLLGDHLGHLLNVNANQVRIIVAWLVATLMDLQVPILWLGGEYGTGKSTAARLLTRLIDPYGGDELRKPPAKPDEVLPTMNDGFVIAFDNVGGIPRWLSDDLARIVSGHTVVQRQLFHDADQTLRYKLRKPVIVTAIASDGGAPDMVSRLLPIALEFVHEDQRKPEAGLVAYFGEHHAAMFGAVLELMVVALEAMRNHPHGTPGRHSRFVGFDEVCHAIDEAAGWSTFTDWLTITTSVQAELVKGDALATAIVALVEANAGTWSGLTSELLPALEGYRPDDARTPWPKNARALGHKLPAITTPLRHAGIDVTRDKRRDGNAYTFTQRPDEGTAPTGAHHEALDLEVAAVERLAFAFGELEHDADEHDADRWGDHE